MKNLSWKAIFSGVGIMWGASIVLGIVLGILFVALGADLEAAHSQNSAWLMLQALLSAGFYFSGSLVTARIAKQAVFLHAFFVWMLGFSTTLLAELVFPSGYSFGFYLFSTLLDCAAALAGAFVYLKSFE